MHRKTGEVQSEPGTSLVVVNRRTHLMKIHPDAKQHNKQVCEGTVQKFIIEWFHNNRVKRTDEKSIMSRVKALFPDGVMTNRSP